MKPCLRFFLLIVAIFLVAPQVRATSVGTSTDHCPFCGHDYIVWVLLSYTSFGGNGGAPQMPPSACPFCLAVWSGDPPKSLTKQQRHDLQAALETWPNDLSKTERLQLLRELGEKYSEGLQSRIRQELQKRCAAALKGQKLPKFVVPPEYSGKQSSEYGKKDHDNFLRELPRLIRAQKEGKQAFITPELKFSSEDVVTLSQADEEIVRGNPLAFEYAVRWAMAVEDKRLFDQNDSIKSTFSDLLFNVARCKRLPWPKGIDISEARSSFAADCLRYAYEPDRKFDVLTLRKALSDSVMLYETRFKILSILGGVEKAQEMPIPGSRARIILAAAAGKRDRAIMQALQSLSPSQLVVLFDSFALYCKRVGMPKDLDFLEKGATYAMNKFEAGRMRGRDEGYLYDNPLKAYEITRLRSQLMGHPVQFVFAK